MFHWKNYLLGKKELYDVCGEKSSQEGPGSHITRLLSEARGTFYCLRGLQAPATVAVACLWKGMVVRGCVPGLWMPGWE